MATELNYNDLVVVAHDEWKLRCPTSAQTVEQSEYLGSFEWRVTFAQQSTLTVVCEQFKDQNVLNEAAEGPAKKVQKLNSSSLQSDEFHLELFIYARKNGAILDYKLANNASSPNPLRTLFKQNNNASDSAQASDNCHSFSYSLPDHCEFVAVNVRILKDRALFHDFTVDRPIGILSNDQKLKVGEQVFHLNKQLLGLVSPLFKQMEAKQDTIETGETDVALFHDFLLAIIPTSNKYDVLPNSKNLAGLLRLAECYGVDSLFSKFEHSLKLCREISVTERILLAKKYMGKEFNLDGILHGVKNTEEFRSICKALFYEK